MKNTETAVDHETGKERLEEIKIRIGWSALPEIKWVESTEEEKGRGIPLSKMSDGRLMILKQKFATIKGGEYKEKWIPVEVEEKS